MKYGEIRSILWEMLFDKVGSYEFKNELVNRAIDAVKRGNASELEGRMSLFNPDTGELDVWQAEAVHNVAEKYGVANFVRVVIFEDALKRIVDERFGSPELEERIKGRARRAIESGSLIPLKKLVLGTDAAGKRYELTGSDLEKKAKEIGLWDYVEKEIEKKNKK